MNQPDQQMDADVVPTSPVIGQTEALAAVTALWEGHAGRKGSVSLTAQPDGALLLQLEDTGIRALHFRTRFMVREALQRGITMESSGEVRFPDAAACVACCETLQKSKARTPDWD